ncbi:hypothetical protein [Pseudoclavibacter terrae]|uniref:Uncharacterized protein n=1 Tax=Pseudoclavibacter terrae TaxID=1530195 RepID=A0A7J5B3L5_9MICO|nr:hypothetical protein [Pseudoclavibacter terrae]KAB1638498.1 hypothetical protein F8O03_08935 [Pseudoclavibacter terrae]
MPRRSDSSVPADAGRDFVRKMGATAYTPLEAMLDAAVLPWQPAYRAEVSSISASIRPEAQRLFDADTARLLAEDPERRDLISPAPWRNSLRILGFLSAATTLAGVLIAAGGGPRNQPPVDASVTAVVVGVTSALTFLLVGASMLFPSKMGVPNRLASLSSTPSPRCWRAKRPGSTRRGCAPHRQEHWACRSPLTRRTSTCTSDTRS